MVVTISGAEVGLISMTQRLFTGRNLRGAAVGSVTLTSNGKHHALCACFGGGRSVFFTIVRARVRHISITIQSITGERVSLRRGIIRVVCTRLSTVGRIIRHGNGLHTRFFHGA